MLPGRVDVGLLFHNVNKFLQVSLYYVCILYLHVKQTCMVI